MLEFFRHSFLSSRGQRESLIVKLKHGEVYAWGEYAPWLGIHHHSLADVEAMLKDIKVDWPKIFSLDNSGLRAFFKKLPYPVSYLLSQAHFNFGCTKSPAPDEHVALCGLVESPDIDVVKAQSSHFKHQGFLAIKVKVGRGSLEKDLARLKVIGTDLALRLDANQSLSLENACALIKSVPIEYFEEPLKNLALWPELKSLGVDLALDESFGPSSDLTKFQGLAQVLIIKPSRFHSFYEVINIAELACSLGMRVVLSHCFESKISQASFAFLAHRLKLEGSQGILGLDELSSGKISLADAQKVLLSFS